MVKGTLQRACKDRSVQKKLSRYQPVVAGGILFASAFTHEIPSSRPNSKQLHGTFLRCSVSLWVEPGKESTKNGENRIEGRGYSSTLLAGNHLVTKAT